MERSSWRSRSFQGSRQAYGRLEERGSWNTRITPDLAEFIAAQTSIFIGTANKEGQPYIQHRGGPRGSLRVLDDQLIGFAEFTGNQQYITQGNLADIPRLISLWSTTRSAGASRSVARRGSWKVTPS